MKKILSFILVFVLCFSFMVVPSYASSISSGRPDINNLPPLPEPRFENTRYVILYNPYNGHTDLLYIDGDTQVSDISGFVNPNVNNNNLSSYCVTRRNPSNYESWIYHYKLHDTNEWKLNNSYLTNNNESQVYNFDIGGKLQSDGTLISYAGYSPVEILYSSHRVAIYKSSDNSYIDFFMQTPYQTQTLATVVGEAIQKALTTVVGTMKILALCGVGCLALLMVLNLFGRVFRIFQVK